MLTSITTAFIGILLYLLALFMAIMCGIRAERFSKGIEGDSMDIMLLVGTSIVALMAVCLLLVRP